MRLFTVLITLLLPAQTLAAPFFIETTYATGEAPVQPTGTRGGGSGARYSEPILKEAAATQEVPVSSASTKEAQSSSSYPHSYSSLPTSSASSVYVPPAPRSEPEQSQEELDELTLEQLEAYANEAQQNLEEQLEKLREGISVTGTSTLGSPLPANQRSAILRSNVRTVDQLQLFAKALAESDENLRKFAVNDEGIEMTYRAKAYLFGFIPVSYLVSVHAMYDGTVEVDAPWWLFLGRDTNDEFTEELSATLPELLQEVAAHNDGQKFQIVSNALKSLHDTAKAIIQNTRA